MQEITKSGQVSSCKSVEFAPLVAATIFDGVRLTGILLSRVTTWDWIFTVKPYPRRRKATTEFFPYYVTRAYSRVPIEPDCFRSVGEHTIQWGKSYDVAIDRNFKAYGRYSVLPSGQLRCLEITHNQIHLSVLLVRSTLIWAGYRGFKYSSNW